jgi:hypothetical protein
MFRQVESTKPLGCYKQLTTDKGFAQRFSLKMVSRELTVAHCWVRELEVQVIRDVTVYPLVASVPTRWVLAHSTVLWGQLLLWTCATTVSLYVAEVVYAAASHTLLYRQEHQIDGANCRQACSGDSTRVCGGLEAYSVFVEQPVLTQDLIIQLPS